MTTMPQVEPPRFSVLMARAMDLGYDEPLLEAGDALDAETGQRVPVVRVQLHSNPARRNVAAVCRVLPGKPAQRMQRLAFRSALAKALELAMSAEALDAAE